MTYTDAFSEMIVNNSRVRRKAWPEKQYISANESKIYLHDGRGFYDEWARPGEDIRADDWMICNY